jgi:hypothetical protein
VNVEKVESASQSRILSPDTALAPGTRTLDGRSRAPTRQLEHATRASLPSPRFPGEQGWYFNQGELSGTNDRWFSVASLVSAEH